MSNFNDFFRNTGCKIIVDRFFETADSYNPDYKITKLNYEILDEPPYPASYYIENGLSANHKVKITYEINNDFNNPKYTEFEVPKEIDGTFIIEGAYRISTNQLGNDYDCRIKTQGSGDHKINFDYNRYFDLDNEELKIRKVNPELGIPDHPMSFKKSKIQSILDDTEKKELLKLTEKQSKKFMIKLDLDYKPEYITPKLIDECIAFGDDKIRDLIIDKTIESVSTSFMQYIFKDNNKRNFYLARRRITNYFTKYNKLQEQTTAITSLCAKFWRLGSTELQIPPGVNSVNLESFKSKIQISPSVAYNTTFSDLIDIGDTPINNNTNLQNSITVSTHVTDEGVMFDVYTKDFKKITIDYMDYLNSKVVASEYVDYETNTLKPDKNGQVEVKYRMKRKMIPVEEIDLIDLHPDYRLSTTTRRIPFVNYTDSVRISMGTSMLKQSIPIVNAQRPLVDTGNYDDLSDNMLNEKFKYPKGVVKEITPDDVIIELPGGEITKIARRTAIQSLNDVSVYTEPKVKVGDEVKENDVIVGGIEIEKDTVKSGLNTLVLFHAYEGLVNEDAVVISESYADRIASYSIIDLSVDVKNSSSLKWIAPIGTRVKSKDSVVSMYKAVKLNAVNAMIDEKLGSLIKDKEGHNISEYTVENNLIVPNNIDDAIVSDVLIQENVRPKIPKNIKKPDYSFARASKTVIDEYVKNKNRQIIYDKYPEYVASDTLDPINLENKSYKVVYTIRVRLIKYSRAVAGEKITSRYGGKGVVSKIVPDEKMPIVNGKRVEVVLNPYSTVNRKIPSVIMEVALGNCAIKIHDNVDILKKTAAGRKKIMPMINKYYDNRYKDMSVEDFINLHNNSKLEDVYNFKVGCFSKFTPQMIQEWMDELGVSTQSEVMMPETDLTDLEELKNNLSPEEYDKVIKEMSGRFIKVEKPLMCGMMTLERLYHQPMYSNKVTSDMVDNKKNEPIAGRGRYRKEGQKIGEMELAVLLSRNARSFINEFRKDVLVEQNQRFLDNLLGLGMMVVDDKGYGQGGSNLKDSLSKMKIKYRLKNS